MWRLCTWRRNLTSAACVPPASAARTSWSATWTQSTRQPSRSSATTAQPPSTGETSWKRTSTAFISSQGPRPHPHLLLLRPPRLRLCRHRRGLFTQSSLSWTPVRASTSTKRASTTTLSWLLSWTGIPPETRTVLAVVMIVWTAFNNYVGQFQDKILLPYRILCCIAI